MISQICNGTALGVAAFHVGRGCSIRRVPILFKVSCLRTVSGELSFSEILLSKQGYLKVVAAVFSSTVSYQHAFALQAVISTHDAVGDPCGELHLKDYLEHIHSMPM